MLNFKPVVRFILLIPLSLSLSGCLVMMADGGTDLSKHQKQAAKKATDTKSPQVYAMRGLLGIFSTGMDSLTKRVNQKLHFKATTMSYLESRKLIKHLNENYNEKQIHTPIILIGHSFGADRQIEVAKKLDKLHIPVDAIIALDNTKKNSVPKNVKAVYNIMSDSSSLSKSLMGWGSQYRAMSQQTKIYNLNVKKDLHIASVDHFNIDTKKEVQDYVISVIKKYSHAT